MNFRFVTSVLLLIILTTSCTKEYDCSNVPIQPVFIGFASSDIDTFVLRKFKANDNYQNLIDTFIVNDNYSVYRINNDTTTVLIGDATDDGKAGILGGYDWQIFIPSTNQIFTLSNIVSENKTGKCRSGYYKTYCNCTNKNFSANFNNQSINFSNPVLDTGRYYLYINR